MQARRSVPGIERSFASAPSADTERQAIEQRSRRWTPTEISIFGHDIAVDVLTGNVTVSCRDIGYRFHDFMFGVTRYYDAQEQYMRRCYLRDFVNVNPSPHWFGNWRFAYEAEVEEAWQGTVAELQVSSGAGVNSLFHQSGSIYRRNRNDGDAMRRALNTYGIPSRTLDAAALDWSFAPGYFLLRTVRGPFRIAAGRFTPETLVDPVDAKVWIFNPAAGWGLLISSEFEAPVAAPGMREMGTGLLATKLVDAMGHMIELKAVGVAPSQAFLLSDGTGRDIRLDLGAELVYRGDHGRRERRRLVSRVTDGSKAAHGVTDFRYDNSAEPLLAEVILPSSIGNRGFKYHYHPHLPGALAAIENSNGDRVEFEYTEDPLDCDERLAPRLKVRRIRAPEGAVFQYDYDAPGASNTATLSTPSGVERALRYRYIQDKEGTKQRYVTATEVDVMRGYVQDAAGNLVPRAAGAAQRIVNATEYSADNRFNVVKNIDPLGRAVQYAYDDFNNVLGMVDWEGHRTRYAYDVPANADETHPIGYDLASVTHENIVRRLSTASPSGFIERLENPVERFEYARYDASNTTAPSDAGVFSTHRIARRIDVMGKAWLYAYDDANNTSSLLPAMATAPSGASVRNTYDNRGAKTTVTDDYANTHTCVFNAQGCLTSYIDPNNANTAFTYYPCGDWLRDITDPLGNVTTFQRDPDGLVRTILDPANDSVDFEYFANQRVRRIVKHRPAARQDPAVAARTTTAIIDIPTALDYSALGQVTSVANANGLDVRFSFDEAGRLSEWYYNDPAFPARSRFAYDAAGQLLAMSDRGGSVVSYSYHRAGYLKGVQLPPWNDGAANMAGKVVDHTYDYFGRVLDITDSEIPGTRQLCYDKAGSMIARMDGAGPRFRLNYDGDGRMHEALSGDGNYRFKVTLDNLDRIATLRDSAALDGALEWRYTYEKGAAPNRKVLNLFSRQLARFGITEDFDYDAKGRLTQAKTSATQTFSDQALVYRPDDLVAEVKGSDPDAFLYDGLKQLVYESLEPAHQDYDAAGNRMYKADRGAAAPVANIYNGINQLMTESGAGLTLAYDAAGNLASVTDANAAVTRFFFDRSNHLRKVRAAVFEVDYTYQLDGTLVEARYTTMATGAVDVFRFHYLRKRPALIEKNGQLHRIFTWDGLGRLLRIRTGSRLGAGGLPNSVFPVYDYTGNVVLAVDASENILARFTYNAWGQRTQSSDPNGLCDFVGYKGGMADPVTGMVLFGNRWYFPKVGRWLSEDPLASDQKAPAQSLTNLYAYVGNNPVSWRDPSGLDKILAISSSAQPSAAFAAGHSWITIYDTELGTKATYGLWAGLYFEAGAAGNVQTNKEFQTPVASRFYRLTEDQYKLLETYVSTPDEYWLATHACAEWAAEAVLYAVGEDLDSDDNFGFETPRELTRSIADLEAKRPTSLENPLEIVETVNPD